MTETRSAETVRTVQQIFTGMQFAAIGGAGTAAMVAGVSPVAGAGFMVGATAIKLTTMKLRKTAQERAFYRGLIERCDAEMAAEAAENERIMLEIAIEAERQRIEGIRAAQYAAVGLEDPKIWGQGPRLQGNVKAFQSTKSTLKIGPAGLRRRDRILEMASDVLYDEDTNKALRRGIERDLLNYNSATDTKRQEFYLNHLYELTRHAKHLAQSEARQKARETHTTVNGWGEVVHEYHTETDPVTGELMVVQEEHARGEELIKKMYAGMTPLVEPQKPKGDPGEAFPWDLWDEIVDGSPTPSNAPDADRLKAMLSTAQTLISHAKDELHLLEQEKDNLRMVGVGSVRIGDKIHAKRIEIVQLKRVRQKVRVLLSTLP